MAPEVTLHIVDVFLVGGGRVVVDVDATLATEGLTQPETTLQALNFIRRMVNDGRPVLTVDGWPAYATQVVAFVWRGPKRREL